MPDFAIPERGRDYQGYMPPATVETVRAAYALRHGSEPAEVLWCKPGMWLAGPIETKPAIASPVEGNAIAAAPSVEANEQPTESLLAAGLEGQAQWTQQSLI